MIVGSQAINVPVQGSTEIVNNGPQTVYYGGQYVSSTNNVGSIAAGANITLQTSDYWFVSPNGASEIDLIAGVTDVGPLDDRYLHSDGSNLPSSVESASAAFASGVGFGSPNPLTSLAPYAIDQYGFFNNPAYLWQTGQGTTNTGTTATGTNAAGQNTLAVADGTAYTGASNIAIVTAPGTANQQQYQVVSGAAAGACTLTLDRNLVNACPATTPVWPLWQINVHLSNGGFSAWAYWLMQQTVPGGGLALPNPGAGATACFLGDSWALSGNGGGPLQTAFAAAYPSAAALNLQGVGGNTSAQVLARVSSIPAGSKYVIFNEPGINDTSQVVPLATQIANFNAIVAAIQAIGARPVYLAAVPIQGYPQQAKAQSAATKAMMATPQTFPAINGPAALALAAAATGAASAGNNAVLGQTALGNLTTGTYDVAVGFGALALNTTGFYNTAVGALAAASSTTASYVTAVGYQALTLNTTGFNDTAMGANALAENTSGSNNTAFGYGALEANTTASNNTAIGTALQANTTGTQNTGVGTAALVTNTTGNYNTAVGVLALTTLSTGQGNTAIGVAALQLATASNNTAIGYNAAAAATTAGGIVALGYNAMAATTTGTNDTALGYNALSANTTGQFNVAVGSQALGGNTTAGGNIGVGYQAGQGLTTGGDNVMIGFSAGVTATSANKSVTGQSNTFVGMLTGPSNTNDPSYSTALGYGALVGASGAVAIGVDHSGTSATASSQDYFVLGTTNHKLFVPGLPTSDPHVVGQLWANSHIVTVSAG